MKKRSLESLQKELYERAIFEKRPSELTKNDLTLILDSLHISVASSFFETDPLEKFMATGWASMMARALQKWALWQESQTIDAALEALDSGGED